MGKGKAQTVCGSWAVVKGLRCNAIRTRVKNRVELRKSAVEDQEPSNADTCGTGCNQQRVSHSYGRDQKHNQIGVVSMTGKSLFRPYAALCRNSGSASVDTFYIRFSAACVKAFDGVERCHCLKTTNNKYIVIKPITDPTVTKKVTQLKLSRRGNAIVLSATGRVNSGFFNRSWFDGRHCKVKKDGVGTIYICLEEQAGENDG